MQLVAYGAQDIYLTGNPQITFFKVVYRRHTNFAVESIEQTFNGTANFNKRVTATISRNGDLIQQMYLEVVLPVCATATSRWTYGIGNALVSQAEIEIGGQLIDRQYGDWMNIWTELTIPAGKRNGYDDMVGNSLLANNGDQLGGIDATAVVNSASDGVRLYVPFQFWFNRNPGLALPLIALQYHEVKLNLTLRPITDLIQNITAAAVTGADASLSLQTCKLYVDYVYLDTDERRRFAQVSHEYLIEQVQFTGTETIAQGDSNKNITLNFNHPVKELIWAHTTATHASAPSATAGAGSWFNYSGLNAAATTTGAGRESFQTALLQLNGHDRFSVRNADYFRKVQNYEHHTRAPRVGSDMNATTTTTVLVTQPGDNTIPNPDVPFPNLVFGSFTGAITAANLVATDNVLKSIAPVFTATSTTSAASFRQYIYSYSFALSPEEHQPSGTCNFSRIDNAVLQLTYNSKAAANGMPIGETNAQSLNLNIYAVNYNVLRIMSGMGGLAYSN